MTDEMKAKRELLFSGSKNGYDRVDQQTLDAMEAYCRDYKSFLDPFRQWQAAFLSVHPLCPR